MSGHEKFYIPHDDLLALKTAMESLETDIETLDVSIQQLITAFTLPSSESKTSGNVILGTPYESEEAFSRILSASDDRYITKARMRLLTVDDPFADYKVDAFFFVSVGGITIMSEFLCDGKHPAVPTNAAGDTWAAARMITMPLTRVAAGATVVGTVTSYGLEVNAAAILDIWHVKGL